MSLTKTEAETIANLLTRLKSANCGCSNSFLPATLTAEAKAHKIELVSRLYVDTWIIPALEMLLPGPDHNPKLAAETSRP